ncbi:MAG: hypothetical protein AAGA17_05465 [Actinomycetota bacterium]
MSKQDEPVEAEPQRITRDDLEAKFKSVTGEVESTATQVRNVAIAAGAAIVVLVVLLAFLTGSRRGRSASTVVEIRRI